MSKRRFACLGLGALLIAGCGDADPRPPGTDGAAPPVEAARPAPDAGPMPATDAATSAEAGSPDAGPSDVKISVPADAAPDVAVVDAAAPLEPTSMVVGAAGGTLMLNEGRLFIPAGALDSSTTISFRTVSAGFPALPGNRAFSSVFSLEPHGKTFAQPVQLTVYHFGGPAKVALYTASPGGAFTRVDSATITLNTAEAAFNHFSYFVVAPQLAGPDAGRDAPPDTAPPDAGPDAPDAAPADVSHPDLGTDTASPPADVAGPDAAVDVLAAVDLARDTAPANLDTGPKTVTVRVRGELAGFDPKIVTIRAGDTIEWVWEAGGIHTVVSGGAGGVGEGTCASDGKFSSGLKAIGETYTFTFTTPGTYGYHCIAHCIQFEGGAIVVQ